MSEPIVVCIDPKVLGEPKFGCVQRRTFTMDALFFAGERPYLLVGPVNDDGSVQVGDMSFKRDPDGGYLWKWEGEEWVEWVEVDSAELMGLIASHVLDTLLDAASRVSNQGEDDRGDR